MIRLPIATLVTGLPTTACSDAPTLCTTEGRSALSVEVRDARTGEPAAVGARGSIREGAYTDTLTVVGPSTMTAMDTYERAGTYDVTVTKPGYRTWTAEDVRVTADACHVRSRTIQAKLEPAP
jgi:hypothetical protein